MTNLSPSLSTTIDSPSLADVLGRIPSIPGTSQARQNMASAVRTLARVLDRTPCQIPLFAPSYRQLISEASPGAIGLSASRWRNVRSDVNRAIRLSGLSVDTPRALLPLTCEWEALVARLSTRTDRHLVRRFGRFCSAQQRQPDEVEGTVVDAYLEDLRLKQLARDPEQSVRTMVRVWNGKIAGALLPSAQRLPSRTNCTSYGPSWGELPPALRHDAEAYRDASVAPPDFDAQELRKPIHRSTARQRHSMLRRIAAGEILSEVDPQELQSLADLVAPERLKHALQFFLDRNGGKQSVQAFEAALLCLGIARHWARLPENQVVRIAHWVKKLRRPNTGMTEKNRERLRQFTSRAVILRILRLPDELAAKASKIPACVASALMAQKAVAIALLTTAPIRVGNLGNLDRQIHFRRAFSTNDRRHHLVIPAAEVKNDVDLEFPVPDRVMTLIDHYMKVYQPLIGDGRPSSVLFPGRSSDRPKELSGLRNGITAMIRK